MIGEVLGHYRIVEKIGEGGMGVVYLGRDEVLHRDVALKVVKRDVGPDQTINQNLLHEARASSSLSHPNICTIYEVGETDGELYIVMELVEGKSLRMLSGEVGLPAESVLRYGVQIASALVRAHDKGIVHRDLKCANILVTSEGLVKVLDFGLAKRIGGGISQATTWTLESAQEKSTVSGTLPYMAPEVLRGEGADYRSDLWALGVVLYEAACGSLPFGGRTAFEISSAILSELPKPLGPPVPPGLWAIIQRCLAKDPMQRYQRASEVQAALEAVQSTVIISNDLGIDRSHASTTTVLQSVQHVQVKKGDFVLLVGTTKGAFLLQSNAQRMRWKVGGPYFHGQAVYAMAYDGRAGRHRVWASTQSIWGTVLRSSEDFGKSWTNPQEASIRFPSDSGLSLQNIWQITLGRPDEPEVLYCGVEPAALFETHDGGDTWSLVQGLFNHPHRHRWMPGTVASLYILLCLTRLIRSECTWQSQPEAFTAPTMEDLPGRRKTGAFELRSCRLKYPEFGQCVHKIAMHPDHPERLFLQNHWGLYRSDDYAENWTDIANGVPSDFGFAMVMNPRNPNCVYIVPVESDEFRCTCDGRLRIYRTRNAGSSWEPLMRGLPQKGAHETVLRDGMTIDSFDPVGIYFGTRSGKVFSSNDEGRTWQKILDGLPPVVSIKSAVVEASDNLTAAPALTQNSSTVTTIGG